MPADLDTVFQHTWRPMLEWRRGHLILRLLDMRWNETRIELISKVVSVAASLTVYRKRKKKPSKKHRDVWPQPAEHTLW